MTALIKSTRLLRPLGTRTRTRAPALLHPQRRRFTSDRAYDVSDADISKLANLPQHPLRLADLVK